MTDLKTFKINVVDTDLVLGTSFKRIKPLKNLSELFKKSCLVEVLDIESLDEFITLYREYQKRDKVNLKIAPKLDFKTLASAIEKRECLIFVIKNSKGVILSGVVVYFSSLPKDLGPLYFGNDFTNFGFLRMFCVAPDHESLAPILLMHVLLELKELELKACLAYVTPQHTKLCNLILPKKNFKRCCGQNFMPENEALFCLELNPENL